MAEETFDPYVEGMDASIVSNIPDATILITAQWTEVTFPLRDGFPVAGRGVTIAVAAGEALWLRDRFEKLRG